jgi:hypothetical protein
MEITDSLEIGVWRGTKDEMRITFFAPIRESALCETSRARVA